MIATGTTGVVLAADYQFRLLTNGLYLAGALLLAAIAIAVASRWRRRPGDERLTPTDQLSHFRSLYERGEISAEEFHRLRTLLGGPVSGAVGAKPPAGVPKVPGDPKPPPAAEGPQNPPDGIRPA
jgi:hypothetical protein